MEDCSLLAQLTHGNLFCQVSTTVDRLQVRGRTTAIVQGGEGPGSSQASCWPGVPAYLHGRLGIVVIIQEGWQPLHNGVGVGWRCSVNSACCCLCHRFGFVGRALRSHRVALAGRLITALCHTKTAQPFMTRTTTFYSMSSATTNPPSYSTRPPNPLSIPLPDITDVHKLKPSHFLFPCPSNTPPRHEASTTPQYCAHRTELGEKVPQGPGQPLPPVCACSTAGNITARRLYLDGYFLEAQSCCWLALTLQEAESPETSGSGSAQAELLG